jgi:ribosomal protein S12 methylthiotransferase accessory factor
MGSSLDPATAMIRAITEAVQARAIFHSGIRDIFFHEHYLHYKAQNAENTMKHLLNQKKEEVDASNLSSEVTTTFEGDIHICLEKLRNVGVDQVIVFECTEPGSDLCVVKIAAPGLEGYMHSYYKPGRRGKAYSEVKHDSFPPCGASAPAHSY